MKRLYNTDILIITLLTVFCLISLVISELNNNYIQIIVEYLIVLFLPGYSILTILFPRTNDFKVKKRLALSFILSISITLLIAILWNYIPSETRLTSILISISIFTLIIQPISFLRRKQVSESFSLSLTELFKRLISSFKAKSQRNKIISIVLTIFIFIGIFTTAYILLSPKESEKFTEFYILGSNGKAYNYPTNLTVTQTGTVYQGIVNHEATDTTYKVIVKFNGTIIKNYKISLKSKEKKEIPVTFVTSNPGQNQKLEFFLYKLPDDKNAYRYLFLQIDVN
ncbi:DUF1616 domain-containing protein [Methanobacterium oryzae]|uniref:DUF1616 domain-containing protein n=1 Tax=Methanobacterium oryzae TaxID=69540 RepID=UPI003D22A3F6